MRLYFSFLVTTSKLHMCKDVNSNLNYRHSSAAVRTLHVQFSETEIYRLGFLNSCTFSSGKLMLTGTFHIYEFKKKIHSRFAEVSSWTPLISIWTIHEGYNAFISLYSDRTYIAFMSEDAVVPVVHWRYIRDNLSGILAC